MAIVLGDGPALRMLTMPARLGLGVPFGLPIPCWLLEPGLAVLRQEPELLLKSRWVVPTRLTRAGFTFTWSTLESAIAGLLELVRERHRLQRKTLEPVFVGWMTGLEPATTATTTRGSTS